MPGGGNEKIRSSGLFLASGDSLCLPNIPEGLGTVGRVTSQYTADFPCCINGMVAQACKPSVREIEAGASRAQDQLELHGSLYLKQQKSQK